MKNIVLFALWLAIAAAQTNPRGPAAGTADFPVRPVREVPRIAWEARPGFRDFGAMAVSGDIVVAGNITSTGGVFAFDAATGKLLWGVRGKQMRGQPAVDAQSVYAVSYIDGVHYRLSSLALKTGKTNWSVEAEELGNPEGSPVVAGGRVFLAGKNGKVNAYESATGKPVWETPFSPGKANCPTAVAFSAGVLYFGGGDFNGPNVKGRFLWALDAATGKELWRYQAKPDAYTRDGACVTAPAVADGIVVTTAENVLFALDARTGALRWKQEVFRTIDGKRKALNLSDVVIAGGTVYSASEAGLGGWSLQSGTQEFDLPGKFGVDAGPYRMTAAGGVLYFIADLERESATAIRYPLYALDLKTKQMLWTHRTNRPSRFSSIAQWRTRWFLPVDGALYYENESILVKLQ